jgi:iron(III) transport system ATP-binding protein
MGYEADLIEPKPGTQAGKPSLAHLQIEKLHKSFGGVVVLDGVDLEVRPGRLLSVLGASGSGKTTLLRLICGFELPDSGVIAIDGCVVDDAHTHLPPERRQIGYVPQEGALFPHLSVADNVAFGLPRRQRRAGHRVAKLLDLVGLPAIFAARSPQSLSGGEQQRVALARALAPSPKLVLLDEPFSSLDAALRAETRVAVVNALAVTGATTLLVTHDQGEALSLGDEVAVLQAGRLMQVSDPVTLYRRPLTADLARFVGEAVLLPAVCANGYVTCALGRLKLASGALDGPADILVRPEQIRLSAPTAGGVRARVRGVTFYGHDAGVDLTVSDGGEARAVTARVAGCATPQVGAEVTLSVEGEVVAFPPRTERSCGNAQEEAPPRTGVSDARATVGSMLSGGTVTRS